jgi:hypothetical protein
MINSVMLFLSKQRRQERRQLEYRRRIAKLCEVDTVAATAQNGVVVTAMMTKKPDPQRGAPITDGYMEYISPWWTTINKVGLRGVILHDGLPEDVIQEATTDCVSFQRCELGEFPILHQRHFAVRDFLVNSDAEYVLVTDVSDVAIKRDPFELIAAHASDVRLVIGSEAKTIGRNKCLKSELTRQYGAAKFLDRKVVNPGILGGRRKETIQFLDLLTAEIQQLRDCLLGSDMSIINYVFHSHYDLSEVLTGPPLHSGFRKWEYNTQAAVMHK